MITIVLKKSQTLLTLIFLFLLSNLKAQIANYNFNNTIQDQINSNDLNHFIYEGLDASYSEILTTSSATFISNSEGIQIELDSLHGLKFPENLKNNIDFTKSLEIEFSFTLTDFADGEGEKYLINWQESLNSPGMAVWLVHDPYSSEDNYSIFFSYSDGNPNGLPNHDGHDKTVIGIHNIDEVVNVRLIVDFENKQWTSIVNGNYIKKDFITSMFDWDTMISDAINDDWYFGWKKDQGYAMYEEANIFTSTIVVNNLLLYSPRQPGNLTAFSYALQAMIAHINGSNDLSLEERTQHLSTIQFNYFGNYNSTSDDIFQYINTYESLNPPIFPDLNQVIIEDLTPEAKLLNFLQLSIFDEEYTIENVSSFEGIVYEVSTVFPGPVNDAATRVQNATLSLDGTYNYNPAARVVGDLADAKRPTGYYAAPGEIITITIPNNFENNGLSVMLGAHDEDYSTFQGVNRFAKISKKYPLNTITTEVISPVGGGIYITVPEGSNLGWFDITISDAVKSPYFSWRTGRKTTPTEWAQEISKNDVGWVDLESDNYMMTMPIAVFENLLDPSELMTKWDTIMNGFWYLGGRPDPRRRSQYFIVDSQLNGAGYGTGYPQVISFGDSNLYPTHILDNSNFWEAQGFDITLHEHGHGDGYPTLELETETNINLPAVHVYNTIFDVPLNDAFKYSSGELLFLDEATMDWMIAQNFRTNQPMGIDPTMDPQVAFELRYQHRSWAKYAKMAELFGWSSMYKMNNVFYEDWKINRPATNGMDVTPDNVISAASYGSNINMAPLMHFYGVQPSEELRTELESLPASSKILELLQYYKSLVPDDLQEFLPWYQSVKQRKDPVHFDRYDYALSNFENDGYSQAMNNQIDLIIDLYFANQTSLTTTVIEDSGLIKIAVLPSTIENKTIETVSSNGPGNVAINSDGKSIDYIPETNYNGIEIISYTILENSSQTNGTLTVTVTPINDAPLVTDDLETISQNSGLTNINVIDNDSDVENEILTLLSVSTSGSGTVSVNSNQNSVDYSTTTDFTGVDLISYIVSDGIDQSEGKIQITVTPSDQNAPIAIQDFHIMDEDSGPTSINVIANDVVSNNNSLTLLSVTNPVSGVASVNDDGASVDFTPNTHFNGEVIIYYTITDGQNTSNGVLVITVTPVNDIPVTIDDFIEIEDAVFGYQNNLVTIDVIKNDTDADGDLLSLINVSTIDNGSVTLNTNGVDINYAWDEGFIGYEEVTYTISDGDNQADGTLTIAVPPINNNRPLVVNDNVTIDEDSGITIINVLDNDVDEDGDTLNIVSVGDVLNGEVSLASDGLTITYTPDDNFNGSENFYYVLSDGWEEAELEGEVLIIINSVNDSPVANPDIWTVQENDDANYYNVINNDTDVDLGTDLVLTAVETSGNGIVSLASDGDSVIYSPATDFNGIEEVTYTVSDGFIEVNGTLTITVTPAEDNIAPVLTEVTPIETPSNNRTPSYIFTTSEEGTITSSLEFSSTDNATTGTNQVITFNELVYGSYSGETITVTDASGNDGSLIIPEFVIDQTANSVEIPDFTSLILYPNPANNKIFIKANSSFNYSLYSILGQKIIFGEIFEGDNVINISNLSVGVYFMKFDKESIIFSKKIVKKQ
tara:strand:- start:111 stop:4964 length:4854 start_codon:yes stop_codon:yes gene_type:complete